MTTASSKKIVPLAVAGFTLLLLLAGVAVSAQAQAGDETTPASAVVPASTPASGSFLQRARNLLNTGMEAHRQSRTATALLPNEDPRLERELRQSISQATDLINEYRQNGLSNAPGVSNLPGLGTIMRVPDKLLRAELAMLQDEIRMAQEMMRNPISATVNAPRDIASMFSRMAEQLAQ